MLFIYFFLIFVSLSITNIYVVWILIEIIFIFFLLFVLNYENKRVGLVIYFSFQSLISLFLFMVFMFCFSKFIFMLLSAKLGLFPFFYWIILVRVKVGLVSNIFILSLQKIVVFWLIWLTFNISLFFLIIFVYGRLFFVIINLLFISDLWLLLVYSSIANTGIILISVFGSHYLYIVFLYIGIILIIINFLKNSASLREVIFLVFFFLVVPPFILFFIKYFLVISLDFFLKFAFFFFIFDVFVLIYYFSLIFIKFILIDLGVLLYFMNLMIFIFIFIFRNCVTLIIFYKS